MKDEKKTEKKDKTSSAQKSAKKDEKKNHFPPMRLSDLISSLPQPTTPEGLDFYEHYIDPVMPEVRERMLRRAKKNAEPPTDPNAEGESKEYSSFDSNEIDDAWLLVDHVYAVLATKDTRTESEELLYQLLEKLIHGDRSDEETIDTLQKVSSIIPSLFVMPNTKVSSMMVKPGMINAGTQIIDVSGRNKTSKIKVEVDFQQTNLTLPANYTPYDREVFNSVCTLLEAGNTFIWAEQVYRTMTGKKNSEFVSSQAVAAVTKSLLKQMMTVVTIDYSEQAKHYPAMAAEGVEKAHLFGNMLYMKGVTFSVHGQQRTGFQILSTPPVYEYAKRLGQIVSIPLQVLDTKSAIRNTDEIIVIKSYLVRRIEQMKKSKGNTSGVILYETIFSECQIEMNSQVKRNRTRENIRKLLDFWKNEESFIKDYKELLKGRTYYGISIQY